MEKFFYWGEVQRRLTEHAAQTGHCYSFYDAVHDLFQDGLYHEAEDVPKVSFADWNIEDLKELERRLNCTPVQVKHFFPHFQAEMTAVRAVRYALTLESSPIRLAIDQARGLHKLSAYRLIYVARGEGRLFLKGSAQSLPENTFCIMSPGLLHDVVAEPESLLLSVALTEQAVEKTLYKLIREETTVVEYLRSNLGGEDGGYLLFHHCIPREILSFFRGTLHECYTRNEYSQLIYNNYLEILFALLLRQSSDYQWQDVSERRQGKLPMLSVLQYIQDHFRDTSLHETAMRFHYEPCYLGKKIKEATGKKYTEIVQELRIKEAERLLDNTGLSLDEVAIQSGFDSRVHFYRSFRHAVGMTPNEYRKKKYS